MQLHQQPRAAPALARSEKDKLYKQMQNHAPYERDSRIANIQFISPSRLQE